MSVIANNIVAGAAGQGGADAAYEISRSVRFNSSDSAYLSRGSFANSDTKTMTFSFWLKRSAPTSVTATQYIFSGGDNGTIYFSSGNSDKLSFNLRGTSGTNFFTNTEAELRDFSAWYHIVVALDLDNATTSERFKCYINGVLQTMSSTNYPNNNFHDGGTWYIGSYTGTQYYPDFYLADFYYIAGQALAPTDFGEYDDNNVWQPKEYTGSFGTNGFHLPFDDNSTAAALGTDTSGNSNTWTVNNISVAAGADNDSLVDVPTNGTETDTGVGGEVRGNYATMNPLHNPTGASFSNGNLQVSNSTGWYSHTGTIGVVSGKWYYEFEKTSGSYTGVGWTNYITTAPNPSFNANGGGMYLSHNGNKQSSAGSVSYGATWGNGDIVGVAFDRDAGTIEFYKNGVSQGQAFTGMTDGTFFPEVQIYQSGGVINFGQRPFAYTAPSGFKALCTANLDAPVVTKPSEYMNVVTYTGNGGTQTISGLDLSPDLVWIKARSAAYSNHLYDIVRGATLRLRSDQTAAEGVKQGVTAFNSDGFDLGSDLNSNENSTTYVAWNWDAGSSTVTNTDGSITSSVRANPSAGFSIVTWTGTGSPATLGHGLGVAPVLYIFKNRNSSSNWMVKTTLVDGSLDFLYLNSTAAKADSSITAPTSSVINLGNGITDENASGADYISYCFAPVDGYSSFGSYTGNGSTDGPFIYTGFRPRWVMMKNSTTGGTYFDWRILDVSRHPYNGGSANADFPPTLFANTSGAEVAWDNIDILSNGFKIKDSSISLNANNSVNIYAAFAENPFALNARAR